MEQIVGINKAGSLNQVGVFGITSQSPGQLAIRPVLVDTNVVGYELTNKPFIVGVTQLQFPVFGPGFIHELVSTGFYITVGTVTIVDFAIPTVSKAFLGNVLNPVNGAGYALFPRWFGVDTDYVTVDITATVAGFIYARLQIIKHPL